MRVEVATKIFQERPLWCAILLCLAVRFAEHAWLGVSFDMVMDQQWQLLDGELLRDHPWRSLYLMHMQPPLFNGLLALSLALPAAIADLFLPALYVMASLVMVAVIYYFLRRFGLSAVASAAAALFLDCRRRSSSSRAISDTRILRPHFSSWRCSSPLDTCQIAGFRISLVWQELS